MFAYAVPDLAQGADVDLVVSIGNVLFPETFELTRHDGRVRVWAESESSAPDVDGRQRAQDKFQIALGVLRAWKRDAGELSEEARFRLGQGSAMDAAGNQWVAINTAIAYFHPEEAEQLAARARARLDESAHLADALWLFGRASRTASDFYMIHQLASMEFGAKKGVAEALAISVNSQDALTSSASNLSPLEGGRKARRTGTVVWDLSHQRDFTAELLRAWIASSSAARGSTTG